MKKQILSLFLSRFRFKMSTSISVQDVHKYFGSRCPQVFRFKMSTSISVQDAHKHFGSRCPQVFRFKMSTSIFSECNKAAVPRTGQQWNHTVFWRACALLTFAFILDTAVRSNDIPNWYSFGLRTLFYDLGLRHYKEKEYKRLRDEKTAYWWLMSAHDMWR